VLARRSTRQTLQPADPLRPDNGFGLDPRLARRLDEELARFDR
jgi:hypothetical protein